MARQLRLEFPGAIYHVSCRMVGDHPSSDKRGGSQTSWPPETCLFRDDADRWRFLDRLAERVEQYNIRLYMFVLMTNHFHLVFETPEGNCSKFMQTVLTAYTVYYNLRHHRHGHLFDGRYKAKLVECDAYLLALSRYVHLNPVKVGAFKEATIEDRIRYLRQYRWSSYPSYIGRRKALDFVQYGPLLAEVSPRRGAGIAGQRKAYRPFVESGMAEDDAEFKAVLDASPRSIGGEDFRSWVNDRYQELVGGRNVLEDVAFRHVADPLPVEVILSKVGKELNVDVGDFLQRHRDSPLRPIAARMLVRFAGQTQRQVAAHLQIGTGAAVSVHIRKLRGLLAEDRGLRRKVKRIESELMALRIAKSGV